MTIWNGCRDDDYGSILRLLIITAQRRDDVGAMAKSEVNLSAGVWSIPNRRADSGLAHEVPLSTIAIAILKSTMSREGTDGRAMVFGRGNSRHGFSGWSKAKLALDERIEETTQLKPFWQVPDNAAIATSSLGDQRVQDMILVKPWSWRVSDIRRTVAARMADLGVLSHVIAAVLSPLKGPTGNPAASDKRWLDDEKRLALDLWAAHVQRLLDGQTAAKIAV